MRALIYIIIFQLLFPTSLFAQANLKCDEVTKALNDVGAEQLKFEGEYVTTLGTKDKASLEELLTLRLTILKTAEANPDLKYGEFTAKEYVSKLEQAIKKIYKTKSFKALSTLNRYFARKYLEDCRTNTEDPEEITRYCAGLAFDKDNLIKQTQKLSNDIFEATLKSATIDFKDPKIFYKACDQIDKKEIKVEACKISANNECEKKHGPGYGLSGESCVSCKNNNQYVKDNQCITCAEGKLAQDNQCVDKEVITENKAKEKKDKKEKKELTKEEKVKKKKEKKYARKMKKIRNYKSRDTWSTIGIVALSLGAAAAVTAGVIWSAESGWYIKKKEEPEDLAQEDNSLQYDSMTYQQYLQMYQNPGFYPAQNSYLTNPAYAAPNPRNGMNLNQILGP